MFRNNQTVCFIGDSITADGRWVYELYEFFCEKNINIRLYNCGIPGGKVSETLKRLECDCFNHNPDTVVAMFGLNDINYHLYGERYYFSEDERKQAICEFEDSLETLAQLMEEKNIKLVLMTPPPYGDFVKSKTENLVHANQGVAIICRIYEEIAKKYNLPLVDINSLFDEYKDKMRLINPDRLHPTAPGHHLISQGFLEFFSLVSEIDSEYPLKRSPRNNLRYEQEKILRAIIFVEWHILKQFFGMPTEFLKSRAREVQKNYLPGEFFYEQLKLYINNIDEINIHLKLLEEYTN